LLDSSRLRELARVVVLSDLPRRLLVAMSTLLATNLSSTRVASLSLLDNLADSGSASLDTARLSGLFVASSVVLCASGDLLAVVSGDSGLRRGLGELKHFARLNKLLILRLKLLRLSNNNK
jgi:hypothetical protein